MINSRLMHYVHTNIISNDWENLANFYIEVFHCEIVPPVRDQKGAWLDRATPNWSSFEIAWIWRFWPNFRNISVYC